MLLNDHMLSPCEDRLEEAVLCYLKAGDDDRPLAPENLLGQYPELASELTGFFADQDRLGPLLAPFRAPTRPVESAYPRAFGRYELLEEIGRGGMGVVYKARQRGLDRLVALKMIRVGALASNAELRRFRNEAESIAHLDHPHIVPIHDVGEHDGQMFFTTPLLARSLNHELARFKDDHRAAARLVASIARALNHAHQRGILHRDVKPSNILLDDAGRSFIADFGLAKRFDVETTLTESGAILGTPGYLAPEQAAGKSRAVTTASDVYSLGAILYTLLTGKPPLGGRSVLETLILVKERDPEPPSRLNPRIDRDLDAICLKCLEKEPARRYGSAEALAQDLERWDRGEPILARPPGRIGRAWRWCRRNPAFAAMTAVIGLLAVFGVASLAVGLALVNRERQLADLHRRVAEDRADQIRRRLYVANVSLGFRHLERGEIDKLDGLLEEFEKDRCSQRFEGRYLREASQYNPRELLTYRGHAGIVYCVTLSPDLRTVASSSEDRSIQLWDADSGETRIVLRPNPATASLPVTGHLEDENGVIFTPDGRRLASVCEDGTVRLWDLEQRSWTPLLPRFQREVHALAVSRDGRFLAAAGRDQVVRVWNVSDRSLYAEFRGHGSVISFVAFSPVGRFLVSSDQGGNQILWNIDDRSKARAFVTGSSVFCAAFSPDGSLLATGDRQGSVRLWLVATGKEVAFRGECVGIVRVVGFSPDGERLLSGDEEGCVRIWSVPEGRLLARFKAHERTVWRAQFDPTGRRLVTCGSDATAKVFELGRAAPTVHWPPSRHLPIGRVAFSPKGPTLAMSTEDGRVLLGDSRRKEPLETLPVAAAPCSWLAFSPLARQVAFVGADGTVKIWLLADRRATNPLPPHVPPPGWRPAIERWSKTSTQPSFLTETDLAVLHGDGSLSIWDRNRLRERVVEAPRTTGPDTGLAVSFDGTTIAVNDSGGRVALLDSQKLEKTIARIPNGLYASALGFSPDGQELAIGCQGGLIRLVDVASGRERITLVGHRDVVNAVVFSPDGLTLASAGRDGSARLWDVETGQELTTLERRSGGNGRSVLFPSEVSSLAFSPDGRMLAVAGVPHEDGTTVSIYDTGPAGGDPVGERARIGIGIDAPAHHESGSSTRRPRSAIP